MKDTNNLNKYGSGVDNMRIYVFCPVTRQRIYLANPIERRSQLNQLFVFRSPYEPSIHHFTSNDLLVGNFGSGAVLLHLI